jgi:hypothetical protein
MSTDEKIIRVHDVPSEVKRLREETSNLMRELNGRGPTKALLLRAKDLRKKLRAQGATIERLVALETSAAIAFRERCGRDPVEGDTILPEDDLRAEEIVISLQSKVVGNC